MSGPFPLPVWVKKQYLCLLMHVFYTKYNSIDDDLAICLLDYCDVFHKPNRSYYSRYTRVAESLPVQNVTPIIINNYESRRHVKSHAKPITLNTCARLNFHVKIAIKSKNT